MTKKYIFQSERLGFRLWTEDDKEKFAKMNSDKDVMEFMPKTLTYEESNGFILRINEHFITYGFGLWAVEIKETNEFIGFIGLLTASFESSFTPCTEIGWRLKKESWNMGYATEGARACLNYGFKELKLDEIYSFTAKINTRSINVMEKIGLKRIGDFNHPNVEDGSPLKAHVLYYKRLLL